MIKVFLDANVAGDLLLRKAKERDKFIAKQIFELIFRKKMEGFISPATLIIMNHFLGAEIKNQNEVKTKMLLLQKICTISCMNHEVAQKAFNPHLTDFEDAMQYYSAEYENAGYFITRNVHDFFKVSIPIVTPSGFLSLARSKMKKH